jgi:hypothetical protein
MAECSPHLGSWEKTTRGALAAKVLPARSPSPSLQIEQRVELDRNEGAKANYQKSPGFLAKLPGLEKNRRMSSGHEQVG